MENECFICFKRIECLQCAYQKSFLKKMEKIGGYFNTNINLGVPNIGIPVLKDPSLILQEIIKG